MDMHAGIKRHKCRLCGNAFTDPANLRMHIKIHGGSLKNKRHVCSKCGLNFRSAKLLQDHDMTTHDKSNLYEDQKNLRFEQNEGLDLSSMQYKPVEGEIITSDTSDNVLAGENCKRKFVTATQQAFGDFNSGLMPLHASHGLVNIGQQLTTGNYFGNSRTLTSIGSANIVNSDIGFSIAKNEIVQMNSEVDHRQLRSDSMTNNLTTLTGSSGKGDDTDPHLEAQPCYNSHL
jgi:rubredoxin